MRAPGIHGMGDPRLDPAARIRARGVRGGDRTRVRRDGIDRPEGGPAPIGREASGGAMPVGAAAGKAFTGRRAVRT